MRTLQIAAWALGALLLGVAVTLLLRRVGSGAGWAEVFVQAAAAIAGAGLWVWRGRARVVLRLGLRHSIHLDIENVGNRTAKDVRVNCIGGIHFLPPREGREAERVFGPEECFGDMERGQRYQVPILLAGGHTKEAWGGLVFEVSCQGARGFGRPSKRLTLGGPGLRLSIQDGSATPLAGIADDMGGIKETLGRLYDALAGLRAQFDPPETGGSIARKACRVCDWDRFLAFHALSGSRFQCANCNADYRTTEQCECVGVWCKHTPAPSQCRPLPTAQFGSLHGGSTRLPWRSST